MISKWNYLPLTSEEQELEIELAKKFAGKICRQPSDS